MWDNVVPPHTPIACSDFFTREQLIAMLNETKMMDAPVAEPSEMVRLGLEASLVATEKMLDFYRRMDIKVTPQTTLAPDDEKNSAS